MDYKSDGKINYTEFISATIDVSKHASETRLKTMFN